VDAPLRFDAASERDIGPPSGAEAGAGGAAPTPSRDVGAGGDVPEGTDGVLEDDLALSEADAEACPRGQPCDDGDACTFDDRRHDDGCRGRPVVCEDDACMRRTCTGTRACDEVPVEAGADCEDDGNGCTLDACDGRGGCAHVPRVDAPCEDDGNACTADVCDASGVCVHPPTAGVPCVDDGNACTEDRCDALGACAHTARIDAPCADDGNECTFDVCDAAAACVHVARLENSACGPDGALRCCGDDQAVERQVKQGGDPLPDPLTEDEFLSLLDEWDQEAEFSLREADALGKVDYEDGVDTREEIAALRERRAELYVKRSRERKAKQLLSAERRNQRADERTLKESEVQARQAEAQDKRARRNLEQRVKLDAQREESRKERAGLQGEQRIKLDARLSEEQEKLSARHREADEKANFLRRKVAEEKQKLDAQQREAQQKFALAQRDQWNDGRAGAQEETVKLRGEQTEKQLVRGRKVEQRFKQEARFREKDQKLARNQEKEAKVFRSREELTKFNASRAAEEREKQAGVTQ